MADKHFLDYDGLSQFFNGLKQKFYQKPSSGIPKSDLASSVQDSLGKADNALPKSGGTMTGAISMNSKKITSLATPTNNADAATKKYVDDAVSSGGVVSSVNGKNGAVVLEPHDLSFPNDFIVEPFRTKSLDNVATILYASAWALASDIESMQSDLNGKASTSYVNSAISTALTSAVVYKGTKAAVANLPSTGNKVGDMWNVSADGMNYVWDGSNWDAQGATVSGTAITNAEITAILNEISTRVPYIIESSNSGDAWYYEKWSDGRLICCRTFSTNSLAFPTNANWGSLFSVSWMNTAVNKSGRRYPIPFVSQPTVSVTPICGVGNFWVCTNQENDSGKDGDGYSMLRSTHAPAWQCVRGSNGTITNPQIAVRAEGYWK